VVKHRAEIAHAKPRLQGSEVAPRQSDVDGEREPLHAGGNFSFLDLFLFGCRLYDIGTFRDSWRTTSQFWQPNEQTADTQD